MAFEIPFLAGALLALSLAAPPGPANALMAQETARRGYAAGWVTGMGAVAGDLTMLALTTFGTLRVLALVPQLQVALALLGAVLMIKFAHDAWAAARLPELPEAGGKAGFFRNYIIVVTSPFNFAWWLTAGTALLADLGWWGAVGFFAALVAWVSGWNALALYGKRRITRFAHWVGYASAVVLALFALVLLVYVAREAGPLFGLA